MDCGNLANCGDEGIHECCCEYLDDPNKCVRFDLDERGPCPRGPQGTGGVCACCQEAEKNSKPTPPSGRPVIMFEVPPAKFDDLTTHKRDYVKKPLPKREMAPWHPIRKLRWKPLEVPSFVRTTYQTDFAPPKVSRILCAAPADVPKFEPIKEEKQAPPPQPQRLCKRMTRGPDHVHGLCDKTQIGQNRTYVLEEGQAPCRQCNVCTFGNPPTKSQQKHDPQCELHCFSSHARCHTMEQEQFQPAPVYEQYEPVPAPVRTTPAQFTVCEKDGGSKERWWKRGCNNRNQPDDCDCTENLNPARPVKFERGGLIP